MPISIGETFRVTATMTDLEGNPFVPTSQSVQLYLGGTLQYTNNAPIAGGGGYYVDFTTASTDSSGNWLVVWTATNGVITGIGKMKIYIDDPPV